MRANRPLRVVAIVAAAVLALIVVSVFSFSSSRTATAQPDGIGTSGGDPAAATSAPRSTSDSQGPIVAAVGDSIMDGHDIGPDAAWPVLVAEQNDWQLTNFATDGAGFVQTGDDGTTFQLEVDSVAALEPPPSIVIISASTNDLDDDGNALAGLGPTTLSTMQSLRTALPEAQIIALSAFWGDTTPPASLDDLNEALSSAASNVGAIYIDIGQPLIDRPDLMQDDDVHPTAQGLQLLATAIAADITAQAPPG